jgi:hypothetical protein
MGCVGHLNRPTTDNVENVVKEDKIDGSMVTATIMIL